MNLIDPPYAPFRMYAPPSWQLVQPSLTSHYREPTRNSMMERFINYLTFTHTITNLELRGFKHELDR